MIEKERKLPRGLIVMSIIINMGIYNFIWIVAFFYLGRFSPEEHLYMSELSLISFVFFTLLALLAARIAWQPALHLERMDSLPLLELGLKRLYALPLINILIFLGAGSLFAGSTFVIVQSIGPGPLTGKVSLVGMMAGSLGVPMNVYLMTAMHIGPYASQISEKVLMGGGTVTGHKIGLRLKIALSLILFALGYTAWLGGLAYYTGVNQSIDASMNGDRNLAKALLQKNIESDSVSIDENASIHFFQGKGDEGIRNLFPGSAVIPDRANLSEGFFDNKNDRTVNCQFGESSYFCVERQIQGGMKYFGWFWFWIGVFVLAAFIVAFIISIYTSSHIFRSVNRLGWMVSSMEAGNLTGRAGPESLDEIGSLSVIVNRFFDSLSNRINSIRSIADGLMSRNTSLSRNAEKLSGVAMEQASATEQASAAMEQMTAAINDVAGTISAQSSGIQKAIETIEKDMDVSLGQLGEKAKSVREKADLSAKLAQEAESASAVAGEGMKKIVESSGAILEILEAINDISDRTNLLSLNASIEAARAGEAGRGFAVVASEISRLADQSTAAAKQIASLLGTAQQNLQQGHGRMNALAKNIKDMRDSAAATSELGISMENAIQDQLNLSTRIRTSMMQMSTMAGQVVDTQKQQLASAREMEKTIEAINALAQTGTSQSQDTAHSVKEMLENTESLYRTVADFKISQG